MYDIKLRVPKSVYPAATLLKAAYQFLDQVYLHIEDAATEWLIYMETKSDVQVAADHLKGAFENELIAQAVRWNIYQQTHTVREILLARAMTSTMVDMEDPLAQIAADEQDVSADELDGILTNWFESHAK